MTSEQARSLAAQGLVDIVRVGAVVTKDVAGRVTKSLETTVSKSDNAKRRVTVVASTEFVDRASDVIVQAGWRLDAYRRDGVVMLAHRYDRLPIGRCTAIAVKNGKLLADIEFAAEDVSADADAAWRLVEAEILKSVSVGFKPIRSELRKDGSGFTYLEQDLLELSWVAVPACRDALIVELATSRGAKVDQKRRELNLARSAPRLSAARATLTRMRT